MMDLGILSVNGQNVANISNEELIKIINQASDESLLIEVKNKSYQNDNVRESRDHHPSVTLRLSDKSVESEVQTEAGGNLCDNCCDFFNSYYNFNYDTLPLDQETEENFLYPDLQYEVQQSYDLMKHFKLNCVLLFVIAKNSSTLSSSF